MTTTSEYKMRSTIRNDGAFCILSKVVTNDNFFIICLIEVEIENKAINRKKLKLFKMRIDKIRILWYNIYSKGGEKIDI